MGCIRQNWWLGLDATPISVAPLERGMGRPQPSQLGRLSEANLVKWVWVIPMGVGGSQRNRAGRSKHGKERSLRRARVSGERVAGRGAWGAYALGGEGPRRPGRLFLLGGDAPEGLDGLRGRGRRERGVKRDGRGGRRKGCGGGFRVGATLPHGVRSYAMRPHTRYKPGATRASRL